MPLEKYSDYFPTGRICVPFHIILYRDVNELTENCTVTAEIKLIETHGQYNLTCIHVQVNMNSCQPESKCSIVCAVTCTSWPHFFKNDHLEK